MSQSPRNEPPRHKSLAREFMVPGIVFVGAIVVALLVLMFTGGADNGAAPSTTQENQIPEELRTLDQWLTWRLRPPRKGEGKARKVPFIPGTSQEASSTDPAGSIGGHPCVCGEHEPGEAGIR